MQKPKINLALLYGGTSTERPISLMSAQSVLAHLDRKKYKIHKYDTATDIPRLVRQAKKLDVALIALHGRGGEDGSIQGLLEILDIPYTGSGIRSSANCMDKITTKIFYRHAGLPTPRDLIITRTEKPNPEKIIKTIGLPCVVKTPHGGSSIGVYICHSRTALTRAIHQALQYDHHAYIEQYITGREFTVAILDHTPLPVIEIIPKTKWFDYETKYNSNLCQEICPADIPPTLTRKFQTLALQAHQTLNCRSISRTDILLDTKTLKPYLIETNTIPGLTAVSLLPLAASTAGTPFPDLLDQMITHALPQKQK